MLVPAIPYFVVAGALGAGGYVALTRKERRPLHIAGVVVGLGGASLLIIVFLAAGHRTYVFRGTAPAITWTRSYLFGTKDVTLDSTSKTVSIGGERGTWIVNDTNVPLKISRTTGKVLAFDDSERELLAPGSATVSEAGVHHIGSDDVAAPRGNQTLVHVGW